jgi:hypothetical protein
MAVGCLVSLGIMDVVGILEGESVGANVTGNPVTGAVVIGEAKGDAVVGAAVSF